MGSRCRLCGGKLSGNRCTECGLDNSVNDRNRVRNGGLEHAALEKNVFMPKEESSTVRTKTQGNHTQKNNAQKYHAQKNYNQKNSGQKNKKSGKAATIISILCVMIPLIISFAPNIAELLSAMGTRTPEVEIDYEYNEYEWVTRKIPEEGEGFVSALEGGVYKVGVHIPEGIYEVSILKGSGGVDIKDDENAIYIYRNMGEEVSCEDIRLYNGAQVRVESGASIQFVTENAQPLVQECMENPLKDSYTLEHIVTVGVDGPAPGIYDIRWEKGSGWIEYMMPEWDYSETIFINNYHYNSNGESEENSNPVYRNVVLPEGMELMIEDGAKFTLIPSEGYYKEDMDSYYDGY